MSQPIRWTYAFIDRPVEGFGPARDFWTAVTRTRLSPPRGGRDEFVTLIPEAGDACLKAQAVRSGGGAHLDLAVEDVPGLVTTARRLGADVVAEHPGWTALRSPGGHLFCAVPWNGASVRPPVVEEPGGTADRLDQVCLDLGPTVFDAEVAFWSELTGWESYPGSLPEFHVVRPPAALPVRILLQRLGADRPSSAHLDVACADIDVTRARHERLGAAFVARGAHWLVMRDPAGGTYCLTGRDPWAGGLPG